MHERVGDQPFPESRRPGARWATLLSAVRLATLGIGVVVLLIACSPDCGQSNAITSLRDSTPPSVTLDAASPVAEQRITVHINAAALPTRRVTEMTLLVMPAGAAPAPSASASADPSSTPKATTQPEFTIIRDDTNEVVSATMPRTTAHFIGHPIAWMPLDCPTGEDCDRIYRIRVAAPGLQEGQRLTVGWSVVVDLVYSGVDTYCGIPDGATATVETNDPVAIPATQVAFAAPVVGEETSGAVIARHVTVTSRGSAPTAASLRLSIVQVGREAAGDIPWRPWVRVLADGSSLPSADAVVGFQPYTGNDAAGATLDTPILGDCQGPGDCERGYWIVFQNYAEKPIWAAWGPDLPPPTLGQMSWTVTAMAGYEAVETTTPTLHVRLDDRPGGLSPAPTIDEAAATVTVDDEKAPTAIDTVFTVPDRPQPIDGLDPLAASIVVVHLQGQGDATGVRLEGDGAGPLTGYLNGDSTANLIAHPFDRCPATGPCTVTLHLVGSARPDAVRTGAYSAALDWSLSVVGAPPGTAVTFGSPYELPAP